MSLCVICDIMIGIGIAGAIGTIVITILTWPFGDDGCY